jgi:rhodanese-related sulfurtransferase
MNLRRFLAEAGALLGLAVACALVSNAFAGKERKVALPGDYPNATGFVARPEPAPFAPFEPAPDDPVPVSAAEGPGAAAAPPPAEALPAAGPSSPAVPGLEARRSAPIPAQARIPAQAPAPAPQGPASPADLLARFPAHGQPWVEISGDAAAWLHARGALFLDARRSREYAQGHIAGSLAFPIWESEVVKGRIEALVAEGRDGNLPVVLYCSGGDCEDSHMLAQSLFGAGFENLLVYRDGYPDWIARGGAVAAGGPS